MHHFTVYLHLIYKTGIIYAQKYFKDEEEDFFRM
jgi:hypothetical protein